MNSSEKQIYLLSTLLQLEQNARRAATYPELCFIIVNETFRLLPYRQAVLWRKIPSGRIKIDAVSGVDRVDDHTPFCMDIKEVIRFVLKHPEKDKIHLIKSENLKDPLQKRWAEHSAGNDIWCPLINSKHDAVGILFMRDHPWDKGEIVTLERLSDAFSHALDALKGKRSIIKNALSARWPRRIFQMALLIITAFMLSLNVRLSVLAPVEIVPFQPTMVNAPMDGVVKHIFVSPNQQIKREQLLFSLDDIALRNEYKVAQKALSVVRAEYKQSTQEAFADDKSKAHMLLLKAKLDQKQAEVDYLSEILNKSVIRAKHRGMVVFTDVTDWIGKPVVVGEKVMTIADPEQVEGDIQLAVEDAVNLEPGAEVKIFLNIEPHRPLAATLRQASYEASVTPAGTLAFRLKASLNKKSGTPRLGLRGTAKIYGERVSVFYYLMRRPLSMFRQFFGV